MNTPIPGLALPGEGQRRRRDAVSLLTCYIFLLMIIPSALVVGPLGGAGSPATIFAAVLFIAYLVTWLHPGLTLTSGRQPIRFAAVVFGCATVASYVSANRNNLGTLAVNGADRGIIIGAGWIGVLLLAADGINTGERLRTLLRRIVLAATAMAALGVTQFFTGLNAAKYIVIPGLTNQVPFTDLGQLNGLNRPSSTAAHPLEFAAVMAMSLPIAVHQARFAVRKLRIRRWVQVALIGAVLPMTVTRTAILAIAVACLVMLPTWPKRDRRIAYGVAAISLIIVFVAIPGMLGTFRGLFLSISSDTADTSRTGAFSESGPLVTQHPWLGMGFGTFLPQTFFFTDDQYLNSLIEVGIIGLLALLTLFATGWVMARKARKTLVDPESRDLMQCLAAAVAVSAAAFATFDALSFSIAAGLTFVLLGCVGAAWRLTSADSISVVGEATYARHPEAPAAASTPSARLR